MSHSDTDSKFFNKFSSLFHKFSIDSIERTTFIFNESLELVDLSSRTFVSGIIDNNKLRQ